MWHSRNVAEQGDTPHSDNRQTVRLLGCLSHICTWWYYLHAATLVIMVII